MPALSDEQEQHIYAALYAGRKIEAIKLHRQASGWGLKESKDFVDELEAQLRLETPEKFSAAASRKAGCSVGVLAMTSAAVLWAMFAR